MPRDSRESPEGRRAASRALPSATLGHPQPNAENNASKTPPPAHTAQHAKSKDARRTPSCAQRDPTRLETRGEDTPCEAAADRTWRTRMRRTRNPAYYDRREKPLSCPIPQMALERLPLSAAKLRLGINESGRGRERA